MVGHVKHEQVIFAEGGVTVDGGPVLVVPCCSNMGGGRQGQTASSRLSTCFLRVAIVAAQGMGCAQLEWASLLYPVCQEEWRVGSL